VPKFIDQFISWLYICRMWGTRCSTIDPSCGCCEKWIEHDEIFNEGNGGVIRDDTELEQKI